MSKLRIYIPVLVALLSLAAAIPATAADALKIVYNVGVAPLKFEDADLHPAGLFPDLWRLWAQKAGRKIACDRDGARPGHGHCREYSGDVHP